MNCVPKGSIDNNSSVLVHDTWLAPRGGGGGGGGVVLGPKTDEGVPLAAETWTQKDRGKNEIWGLKDQIL